MNEMIKRPHAALVHLPITLYTVSFVFLLLYWGLHQANFLSSAFWCFVFAVIAIIPVGLTGFLDMFRLKNYSPEGGRLLNLHMLNGILITLISIIAGWYFIQNRPTEYADLVLPFAVMVGGTSLLIMAQGLIAAMMIYQHHIGIDGETR